MIAEALRVADSRKEREVFNLHLILDASDKSEIL